MSKKRSKAARETAQTIVVVGYGEAFGEPDIAYVSLGVESIDPDVAEAFRATSNAMNSVIASLHALRIAPSDIRTTSVNVHQRALPRPTNDAPFVYEHVVSNSVQVTVRDTEQLSDVLTTAVRHGANQIESVRHAVADPSALAAQARALAVADAHRRATELASGLNVKVGRALQVIEGTGIEEPLRNPRIAFELSAKFDAPMPVSAGELSISARVKIVFAIEPADSVS